MSPAFDAKLAHLSVPDRARSEWFALAAAIEQRGPASCEGTDPEAWWPHGKNDGATAVLACRLCPVRAECLAYALAARERDGVWGGLTAAERAG